LSLHNMIIELQLQFTSRATQNCLALFPIASRSFPKHQEYPLLGVYVRRARGSLCRR
jgi:hypothetical protein